MNTLKSETWLVGDLGPAIEFLRAPVSSFVNRDLSVFLPFLPELLRCSQVWEMLSKL